VEFKPILIGPQAGECRVCFTRGEEEVDGIVSMCKRLNAFQSAIDETNDGWCYYKCLDIIETIDKVLRELGEKRQSSVDDVFEK